VTGSQSPGAPPGGRPTRVLEDPDQADQVARIVHELRSPLAATLQAVELMARTPDAPPDPDMLAIARRQLTSGLRRVEQLLVLLSGEGHHALDDPEPHHLRQLVDEILAARPAPEEQAALDVDIDPRLMVAVDRVAFEHVLDNLVANAVRHAPAGTPVEVTATGRDDEVWLEVSDGGPGIDPDVAPRVFEPFVRGPGGGAGLGLAIVRQLVDAQRGRVWIEANAPRGTRVVIALPRA
jgi:two-component system, OmpR family, sensor kinase